MQLEQARARDPIAVSLFAWKTAIAILTIITSIFCFLTVMDAQSPKCAGQESLLGQRSGLSDLLAPAIMSVVIAIVIAIRVTSKKVRQYLWSDQELKFRFIFLTPDRMSATIASLIGFLIIFGMITWISAKRYNAISDFCQSVAVDLPTAPTVPTR